MIYKRGKKGLYWYKFVWQGQLVRESTKQGNDKVARQMEAAHRTSLAKGEVGIREKKPAPMLKEFLKQEFLPYAETAHISRPRTLRHYKQGSDMLLRSKIVGLAIDQISDQNAQHFAAEYARLSPSGINRGLRTLRRALNLAYQWGRIEKPVRIFLAKGENQRDRVLTDKELHDYLAACPQPWKDCATIIAEEGMRPGEVFVLQWQHIALNDGGGLIRIADGKSKAARRVLPMTPNVYALVQGRHEAAGRPAEGWVFPSASSEGHFNGDVASKQHTRALKDSCVQQFEPYVLRHTALTNLAKKGADAHTLARIAGHSSIVITMRYVHPQADAIERAFAMAHGKVNRKRPSLSRGGIAKVSTTGPILSGVGTKLGTIEKHGEKSPALSGAVKSTERLSGQGFTTGAGRGT
jgi:integrase